MGHDHSPDNKGHGHEAHGHDAHHHRKWFENKGLNNKNYKFTQMKMEIIYKKKIIII